MLALTALLDLCFDLAGLHGLTWAGRLRWWLLLHGGRPRRRTMLPALLLQLLLAVWRRRRNDPLQRLRPGRYADRVIERIDLPTRHGALPALIVTPHTTPRGVVLVTHGSGCDKTFYAWPLVDALIGRELAVALVDLEGHGENPRPQAHPAIVETISDGLAWLHPRFSRVALLGMSLGGAVAAAAAVAGPAPHALVLWEVPPQLRLDAAAYRRVQLREALAIVQPRLLYLFREAGVLPMIRAWRTSGIRATIGTWDLFDRLALLEQLPQLRAQHLPTLLIYAGRDNIISAQATAAVATAAAGWADFHLVSHASHVSLPLDRVCLQRTADWLSHRFPPQTA